MKKCSISGCENKYRSIGLCSSHWKINKKYGTPTPICWCGEPAHTFGGNRGSSVLCKTHTLYERLWEYVDIRTDKECWEWNGSKAPGGYGVMWWNGELLRATRIILGLFDKEYINKGSRFALHTCDNPSCVNPKHLFTGSPMDNVEDMFNKNRQQNYDLRSKK